MKPIHILLSMICLLMVGCFAPDIDYPRTPPIVKKRCELYHFLISQLPEEKAKLSTAQEEARWLSDTAYAASAGIARINKPLLPGWLHNRMVNSKINMKERGLCWQYQHDLFRELRRRELHYFHIGFAVRDHGEGSEHNVIYLCAKEKQWPEVVLLDPWLWNGRLKAIYPQDIDKERWYDSDMNMIFLASVYTIGHNYPMEHWAQIKKSGWRIRYISSDDPEAQKERQLRIMRENIERGKLEHPGTLINYEPLPKDY